MRVGASFTSSTARRLAWAGGAALIAVAGMSGASAAAPQASSGSAGTALRLSLAAATKAGSARISVQFFSGSTTGKVLQDSSLRSGKQTVAIGKALASIILTKGTAYISGNAKGMTSFFGLPSALTSALAGKWISIQPTDAAYQSVTANVDLGSALSLVTPSGSLSTGKREMINGQSVTSISGAGPGGGGRLTFFVATGGRRLPVQAVESSGTAKSPKGEIVTFSRWGEQVHVPTPSGAVPISALTTASSGQG